jgi:hypothetical protein
MCAQPGGRFGSSYPQVGLTHTVKVRFVLAISKTSLQTVRVVNPLNAELNPICYLLALLGAHHFLHISRIRIKSLTLRLLLSYIYIYIYLQDISSLRVNTSAHCSGRKQVKGKTGLSHAKHMCMENCTAEVL